jgi:carboxyl-terminal processing protease
MLSFFEILRLMSINFKEYLLVKKHPVAVFILFIFLSTQIFPQGTTSRTVAPPKDSSIKKIDSSTSMEKIESDMAEALTIIQDNYVDGKKPDYSKLMKSSIDGMLHTLDPHSHYYDAKENEEFRNDQNSQYFGIGATIGDLRDPDGKNVVTFIKATFDGAPANKAGLRYGDKIIEVNGESMLGKPFFEVRTRLRGPRGTVAKIVVERYGTGKRETVSITRDAVPQPSVPEAYLIRPGIGYIAMTGGFNRTTYNEFAVAMQTLKSQGMTQLVLDLRGNPGGLVGQAYQVANAFLSRGQTVLSQKGRGAGAREFLMAENPNPEKMPLVVLINRGSASASEILAGALQDHDRAILVGENSFGKGLVAYPFSLEYGSMLMLVVAKYETPSGRLIQRDYSNGNLYDYYNKEAGNENVNKGNESKTDTGRPVYSGNGIMPDEVVKPTTIPIERARQQSKLVDPMFAFALDLAYGKVPGLDPYRADKPITFDYDLKSKDFPMNDAVFQSFKQFAVSKYKISPALIDKEKELVERFLRTELVTSAYGITTSLQVSNDFDNQLMRAIELLPKAKILATEAAKVNTSAEKTRQ